MHELPRRDGSDSRYEYSRDLTYSVMFTFMLARETRSPRLEATHLLGGLYIACWERIARYCKHRDQFEAMILEECRLLDPRWFYWIRAYEQSDRRGREVFWKMSPEVEQIYALAKQLAESRRDPRSNSALMVSPEDFLLAIAKCPDLEIGAKLIRSRIKLDALEAAVKRRAT